MNIRRVSLSALAAVILGVAACVSVPAIAQSQAPATLEAPAAEAATDAAKPAARKRVKRKTVAKKPKGEVIPRNGAIVVTNRRGANLVELTAMPEKGGNPVVLARDLAAGGKASSKLPAKAGCVFSLSGTFDDDSSMDAANLNLCKDGRVNLVE